MTTVLLLGAVTFAVWRPGAHTTEHAITYAAQRGACYRFSVKNTSETVQEIEGQSFESTIESNGVVRIESEGVDANGNFTFIMSHEELMMLVRSAMLDSTLENPAGLIGKRIRKTVRPNGDQVKSVELDRFEAPAFLPGFSSDQEFLPNLPNRALAGGESLTLLDVDSLHAFGGLIVTSSEIAYTRQDRNRPDSQDCLLFKFSGHMKIDGQGMMQGLPLAIVGNGEVNGSLCFAEKNSMLVSSDTETTIKMTASLSGTESTRIKIAQVMASRVALIE